MSVKIIIPARYGSSRLPGKPLADILGKPMIQHVYEKALLVSGVDQVVIATDDQRVAHAVFQFNGHVVMTNPEHVSGTDRLVEVSQTIDANIYINIQGDEPLVRPEDIETLIQGMLNDDSVMVGTLCHTIDAEEATNPNTVKVVTDEKDNALYFSRSPIPYPRESEHADYLKHVGVYAYRKEILEQYSHIKQPKIEQSESLEQLRLLYSGVKLRTFKVKPTGPGVDTPECLDKVRRILSGQPEQTPPTLADVRLVITDVDGVLTDGGLYYTESGESIKRFHARDGLGIRLLIESGVHVAVVSGRDSTVLRKRLNDLGINYSILGVKDKAQACNQIMQDLSIDSALALFVGDDSIDLPAFTVCGFSAAVADAPDYIQNHASIKLTKNGGQGAFRELADNILLKKNKQCIYETANGFLNTIKNTQQ